MDPQKTLSAKSRALILEIKNGAPLDAEASLEIFSSNGICDVRFILLQFSIDSRPNERRHVCVMGAKVLWEACAESIHCREPGKKYSESEKSSEVV
jgi:hypothetical protein